jgi:hypothetical protein
VSRRTWVGTFLALQQCKTEEEAQKLIASLASPQTRELAQREWDEVYRRSVIRIEAS